MKLIRPRWLPLSLVVLLTVAGCSSASSSALPTVRPGLPSGPTAWPTQAARATAIVASRASLPACTRPTPWYVRWPAHPRLIVRSRAVAIARRVTLFPKRVEIAAVLSRPRVSAALVTGRQWRELTGGTRFIVDCARQRLWVVTVHARLLMESGSAVAVQREISHAYSVVEDARTGQVEDSCVDCALLG